MYDGSEVLLEEVPYGLEDRLPEASEEAVSGGVGEVEGGVADVAVAVPALGGEWVLGGGVGGAEAGQQRVIDAPVHVHEADGIELLVTDVADTPHADKRPSNTTRVDPYQKGDVGPWIPTNSR